MDYIECTHDEYLKIMERQKAKEDADKLRISLVPPAIIKAIARIREYGVQKYGDPENWRRVEIGRYHDAFLRHVVDCMGDLNAVDEESGLPHLHHAACNLAFILEMMEGEDVKN